MAVTKYGNGSFFLPINSGRSCPVCGSKKGRCSEFYNEEGIKTFYRCKYQTSSRPSNGWHIHLVSEIDGYNPLEKPVKVLPNVNVEEQEITQEILELRNNVYTRMRELLFRYEGTYLYKEDLKDLLNRGLSIEQITKMGFFSVPRATTTVWSKQGNFKEKLTTAMSKELENEFGADLLKVPGFIKLKNKRGDDFIIFKTSIKDPKTDKYVDIKGYFVPYFNVVGLLVGMQYRLTNPIIDEKGKQMRYFWYSSSQARSGSPIDYYIPTTIKRDDILLVTEGATKGKIASEYLGFEGIYEAGVHNYKRLVKNIISLEKMVGKKYKIILALDMDKEDNADVLKAEADTVALLKATGHQIAIPEWNKQFKGIDDALINKVKLEYKII